LRQAFTFRQHAASRGNAQRTSEMAAKGLPAPYGPMIELLVAPPQSRHAGCTEASPEARGVARSTRRWPKHETSPEARGQRRRHEGSVAACSPVTK
jgi:hypothetical protein